MEEGGGITFLKQKSCFFVFLKEKPGPTLVAAGMGCCSTAPWGAGRALLCPGAPSHAGGEGSEDHGKGNSPKPMNVSTTSNSAFKFHLTLFRAHQNVFSFQHIGDKTL